LSFLPDNNQSAQMPLPFDTHGCIITGLQPQATLQVTVKYFVERIPTIAQPDLLVLTRPPSPYDGLALEIYSRVMTHLPVGVPVSENPLGEWFNDIMSTIAEWAPRVGALIGTAIPGASALGTAIGGAASLARQVNNSNQPAKKKQNPKPQQHTLQSVPKRVQPATALAQAGTRITGRKRRPKARR